MADVVSLQDVKVHLRYPMTNTSDDAALTGFIWVSHNRSVSNVLCRSFSLRQSEASRMTARE